jgi:hypothetical protein
MNAHWHRSTLAIAALWLAACGTPDEDLAAIPTWESYLADATREYQGETIYVIEGDVAVTLAELRADYERRAAELLREASAGPDIGRTEQESTVNRVGAADDIWSTSVRRDLTYCITNDFGALKARTVAEMATATADWERHGNFNFRYVPAEDAACDNTNPNILFSVRPWTGSGACAFFPSGDACVPRTLVMNYSAFATGAVTSQGVFRHELGHVLGLRHEHIRAPGTWCSEDTSWRAVTAYDSSSVMHYPWCPGATNTGDLFITATDATGVESLYGPSSAHGFAWVTATGGVSAAYSYNSEGGAITATAGPAGAYAVSFAGLGGTGGDVQVVGYGTSNTRCKVASWGGAWPGNLTANVQCHLPDGTPAASAFVVQYARKAASVDGTGAYLWAHDASAASYCPTSVYSWNSTDGVNCIAHGATPGDYTVQLPGLASSGGGTFQVTAYGTLGEHCKIQGWGASGTSQQVRVLCFDAAGAAADARFTLNYFGNQEVSVHDYGAYAWASSATSPLYTPPAFYAYNSGDIAGWPGCVGWLGDISAGKFPDFDGHYFLRYQFLSPFNSAAHSTAYGSSSSYCKVEGWGSSADGAEVRTQCYRADGVKQNSQYVGTYATSLSRGPC